MPDITQAIAFKEKALYLEAMMRLFPVEDRWDDMDDTNEEMAEYLDISEAKYITFSKQLYQDWKTAHKKSSEAGREIIEAVDAGKIQLDENVKKLYLLSKIEISDPKAEALRYQLEVI